MPGAHDWMRLVLADLFAQVDRDHALQSLRDPDARQALRADLDARLAPHGRGAIPAGSRGDNLLQALLSLRVKFSRDEAMAKLETNIAMREHRPSG